MTTTLILWRPFLISWSKRSLSRCGLLDNILCEWQLVGIILSEYGLFWVCGSGWGIVLGRWGWMDVYEVLFWVDGGEWWLVDIILSGLGWLGKYFGWVGVGGDEWGWVHCLIMPIDSTWRRLFSSFLTQDFKKQQNRNETSLKNETKLTGIFAFLVIKLKTPLVLKVQTRTGPATK